MGQGLLSPPILATTLPAFYFNGLDQGADLTVPFTMNKSVGIGQIKGFKVKIKSVQSGNTLGIYNVDISNNKNDIIVKSQFTVKIIENKTIPTWLKVGQFYKVQIAYIDIDDNIGYYSSIAVVKYTSKPQLNINLLDDRNLNAHLYTYEGIYFSDDLTERPYLYRFDLYNYSGVLISSSGDLLHNSSEDDLDTPKKTRDIFTFSQELESNGFCMLKYTVTTNNGLVISSPTYRITQKKSIDPKIDTAVKATVNYDNGYVKIELVATPAGEEQIVTGSFVVTRSCEDTNFSVWDEVHKFKLLAQVPTLFLCKDFTVEQGKRYQYAIQQYSDTLISNRLLSNIVDVDFEDAFLFDGKRQLKIKYNPKVSSFKKDLLETKTDTIGGKYPFIFRNGRVYYSEFSISGLISYQMDEENLFLSEEDYGLSEKTTNLTSDNIAAEREFKMRVLEWLTNGEPKIFRSPTEGNYIVRLMNSSLTPNDTLGRMLHTFNSTVYEIADYNYQTLGEMGFITLGDEQTMTLMWETKNFYEPGIGYINIGSADNPINLLPYTATTIRFDNMTPGDIIKIKFADSAEENIKIGATGSYYIDTGVNIELVELLTPSKGSMTYSYKTVKSPKFEKIYSVAIEERVGQQFIGEQNILQNILCINYNEEWIINPKLEIIDIYNVTIEQRPLQRIKISNNDDLKNHTNSFLMYQCIDNNGNLYYYDSHNNKQSVAYQPQVKINGEIININETQKAFYDRPGKITELINGNGCLTTIAYQLGVITYNIENEAKTLDLTPDHYLYNLKQKLIEYEKAVNDFKNYINADTGNIETDTYEEHRALINSTYINYIIELINAQEEESRRKGEII